MVGEEPYRGLIHFGWLTQLWTVGAKRFEFGEQRAFKGGALGCSCPVPTVKSQHMTPSAPPPSLTVTDFSNPRAQRYAVNRLPQGTSAWANWFGQEPGTDHGNIKH